MDLEILQDYTKVPRELIDEITNEMIKLFIIYQDISKVSVIMKEENIFAAKNKACAIRLVINGHNVVHVYAPAENFERSFMEAVSELKHRLSQRPGKKCQLLISMAAHV